MENNTLTDEQLMATVADGDMGSLGLLVRRHQGQALALAYRTLGRWDQAEDVVQEAFLRVHKAAKRYRGEIHHLVLSYHCQSVPGRKKALPAHRS